MMMTRTMIMFVVRMMMLTMITKNSTDVGV